MSSVILLKAPVILAFKFVISGTDVENTLSLTYPIKRSQGGWYLAIVVARVSDHLSQTTCMETLHPKTDENVNSSVEVHDLVGKLSTAETLLTEVQRTVPTCPGKHLFVIRERLYAHPVYSQEVKQAR